MSVEWVRIGDVTEMQRTPIEITPGESYRRVGIYSWAKGFLHRPPANAEDMGSMRYFTFPDNALVVSNIQAWEGAVAVSGDAERGHVASNRFLPYVPTRVLDARYLFHYLATSEGLDLLRKASPGTTVRNRTLSRKAFENSKIPLTDLPTQHRITARLDSIAERAARVAAATGGRRQFSGLAPRVISSILDSLSLPTIPVTELYETINDTIHPGMDPAPADRFVGLENVSSHTGHRVGSSGINDLRGRKFRFLEGDVLYGYLRPYLNKVWVADGPGLCSVEQYVLRPQSDVDPRLLGHALRAQQTLDKVNAATHRLQLPRIRAGLLGAIQVPDIRKAPDELADQLDGVCAKANRLTMLAEIRAARVSNLLPAARNEEFSRLINT